MGGAHIKLIACTVLRRTGRYTNKHLTLHTDYMYKTRLATDGRWVGRVGGLKMYGVKKK